ncbi:MAG: trimethylamine methyltransferase family protein, partial [bacterium]
LLRRLLDPGARFGLGAAVSPVDMASGACLFGRPEQQRMNALFADLSRFYGCAAWGHTGLTDAARPSTEAGAQKAAGVLLTALACGHGSISAGLLKTDTLCSPVQLVLDDDLAAGLGALLAEFRADDLEGAAAEIAGAGPGGGYLDRDLTGERARTDFFRSRTWTGAGGGSDVARARALVAAFEKTWHPEPRLAAAEEAELRRIIAAAAPRS